MGLQMVDSKRPFERLPTGNHGFEPVVTIELPDDTEGGCFRKYQLKRRMLMKMTTMRRITVAVFGMVMTSAFATASEVYVDARNGCDCKAGTTEAPVKTISKAYSLLRGKEGSQDAGGTIYLYPGTYLADKPIFLTPPSEASDATLTIEAVKLPGEKDWKPEDMPVLLTGSWQGDLGIPGGEVFTSIFVVQRNNVAIRGLKFLGYHQPNSRYIPIIRIQSELNNLKVEQCMFVANIDVPIQVGILADGSGIQVDHCVFYNARNSVVFWRKGAASAKTGNRLAYCIVYGAYQSGVWTALEDEGFEFRNNVITKCRFAWIRNGDNHSDYKAENCVILDNEYEQGVAFTEDVVPEDFGLECINVKKEGTLEFGTVDEVDDPVPHDYLHLVPGSFGSELGAGLFVKD